MSMKKLLLSLGMAAAMLGPAQAAEPCQLSLIIPVLAQASHGSRCQSLING
jgi:hypothetical protein